MLQGAGTLSLKYIHRIKYEGNINNIRLSVMKGILNTKGAALYLPLLLGGHCDPTNHCG